MTTKKLFRRLAILAAVAGSATAALGSGTSGTTYYVSPTGSDSNSGSASAPWKTVARVDRATLAAGDSVLFQGGASFADATLTPPASGTAPAPITFGSYGTGQAKLLNANGAVWMAAGTHDVVFTDLDLSSSGSIIFAAAGSGDGTTGITLQRSTVHDSPYSGVGIQPQDSLWTLSGNTFRHLGDSGLLVQGSQVTIDHNAITDTGWNTALNYGKHGIYAKGPNMTISNNDISFDVNGSAISLRYAGARVFDNVIHDTPYAVSIFPQDPANTGTERIYDNRLWNITGWAFYYAGVAQNGQPSGLNAIWTSNTTQLSSASEAVNVSEISAAQVTIANSIFTGSYGSAYRGCTSCSEYNNDWYGGARTCRTARATHAPTRASQQRRTRAPEQLGADRRRCHVGCRHQLHRRLRRPRLPLLRPRTGPRRRRDSPARRRLRRRLRRRPRQPARRRRPGVVTTPPRSPAGTASSVSLLTGSPPCRQPRSRD